MMNKKNLKSLRNDKRAVSPVIGVILMVAITVILAAVIGAFVFGMTPGADFAPQASLAMSGWSATGFELEHNGGDTVKTGEINVFIGGEAAGGETWATSGALTAGMSSVYNCTTPSINPGDTVKIVHTESQQLLVTAIAHY